MSKPEVAGVPLESFVDPIRFALRHYAATSHNGSVAFEDIEAAAQLTLTPEKPNSARSQTKFLHNGEVAGDLFVIAFKPFDGSGDENTYKLVDLDATGYPEQAGTGIVPRSKAGTYCEQYLPLFSQMIDRASAEPVVFAGHLSLVGFQPYNNPDGNRINGIGQLGNKLTDFARVVTSNEQLDGGVVTSTVWQVPKLDGSGDVERRGDPHAVYNPGEDVLQVCAFVAIKDELAGKHGNIGFDLHARPAYSY